MPVYMWLFHEKRAYVALRYEATVPVTLPITLQGITIAITILMITKCFTPGLSAEHGKHPPYLNIPGTDFLGWTSHRRRKQRLNVQRRT
jgi:hypothetical protein